MSGTAKPFLKIEQVSTGKIVGYEQWESIPLTTDVTTIGRPISSSDANQPDIKIIGDDYISRNHAQISYSFSDGCFMLLDTGSKGGTLLNDELIEKDKPYPLKDRDRIGLAKVSGKIRIVFEFKVTDLTIAPWMVDGGVKPLHNGGFFLSREARKVYLNGIEIPLTKKEFAVLEVLYNRKGQACEIDTIIWEVWGKGDVGDDLVARYIRILREKIEPNASQPCFIKTVPGRHGCYMLVI